ncbi:hypothetical protein CR513_30251, partial [Mucuna pruriens]
ANDIRNIISHVIISFSSNRERFTLLYPFQVIEKDSVTKALNKEICFEFIKLPRTRELNILKESLISKINIIERKKKHINMFNRKIKFKRVEDQLKSNYIQKVIKGLENKIIKEICKINPTAKYEISLPYIKDFNERNIPTKKIQEYLEKELIRLSKSPWSCTGFYVMKASEIERGALRLVINYKPLNKALEWIRYPLPNKNDLIKRIQDSTIFSKFYMKEQDRYRTAFVVPFDHYKWNVMPQGLKNAPIYLDDVLIFSKNINQHIEHLEKFINIIKENGLVVSEKTIKIFQSKIRFLGFEIYQGTIKPIQ